MNSAFENTETVEALPESINTEVSTAEAFVTQPPRKIIVVDESTIPFISVEDFNSAVNHPSYVSYVRDIVSLYEMHHNIYDGHFGPDYMPPYLRTFQIGILQVMNAITKHNRNDLARAVIEGDVFAPCFFRPLFTDWVKNKKVKLILLYAHNHARLHANYKAYALTDFEQVFVWHCDPDLLRELFRRDREAMLCFTSLIGRLIFSKERKHRDLIFFLLDQGFDIETTFLHSGQWLTPLEFVVHNSVSEKKKLINQLIARGANPHHLNRVSRYVSPCLPININLATVAFSCRDAEGITALAEHGVRVTLEDIARFENANGEKNTLIIGGWFIMHGYKNVLKYLPQEYVNRVLARERRYGR